MNCPHCESAMTEKHCENPQCNWLRCKNCRAVSRIVAVL